MRRWLGGVLCLASCWAALAWAQDGAQVVDLPTRNGVSQRILVLEPQTPKAVVLSFAGGHGGLQISAQGALGWGAGNFLVRTRNHWVEQELVVVLVDAPSDRQSSPYLSGRRLTPEHVADVRTVLEWARARYQLPVWLVGTSRGTQSAAYLATELQGAQAPDGIVLTSSIAKDPKGSPVNAMPLEKIRIPVLLVHHEKDACSLCSFADVPSILTRLVHAPRKSLMVFSEGITQGDPCEAYAYHGFNGIEAEVVDRIAGWILQR